MIARNGQGSLNKKQAKKNTTAKDLEVLMSLIDPAVLNSMAEAANKGVGYVEVSPEAQERILKSVMKKVKQLPASS